MVEERDVGLGDGFGLGEAVQEVLELVKGWLAHWVYLLLPYNCNKSKFVYTIE